MTRDHPCRRPGPSLVVIIGLAFVAPSHAPAQRPLRSELDFLRRVAVELDFGALAESELERLRAHEDAAREAEALRRVAIEVALVRTGELTVRSERQRRSSALVDRTAALVGESGTGDDVAFAQIARALACRALAAELLSDADTGARREAAELCRQGLRAVDALADAADAPAADERFVWRLDFLPTYVCERDFLPDLVLVLRGLLHTELARAEPAQLDEHAARAQDAWEEVLFADRQSVLGAIGWSELARIARLAGDPEFAPTMCVEAADVVPEVLRGRNGNVEDAERLSVHWQFLESRACEELFADGRDEELLLRTGALRRLLADLERTADNPLALAHPVYGHRALLHEARALLRSSDADDRARGLELAMQIAERHPRDLVGDEARAVVASAPR